MTLPRVRAQERLDDGPCSNILDGYDFPGDLLDCPVASTAPVKASPHRCPGPKGRSHLSTGPPGASVSSSAHKPKTQIFQSPVSLVAGGFVVSAWNRMRTERLAPSRPLKVDRRSLHRAHRGRAMNLAPYIAALRTRADAPQASRSSSTPTATAIEGEWGPVFMAIEACHQVVPRHGLLAGLHPSRGDQTPVR